MELLVVGVIGIYFAGVVTWRMFKRFGFGGASFPYIAAALFAQTTHTSYVTAMSVAVGLLDMYVILLALLGLSRGINQTVYQMGHPTVIIQQVEKQPEGPVDK
jgi:hypothetical protein